MSSVTSSNKARIDAIIDNFNNTFDAAIMKEKNKLKEINKKIKDNDLYLAKTARNVCVAINLIAIAGLFYQAYQDPSRLNPFSDRSFSPWADNSRWFDKAHLTSIIAGTAHMAATGFQLLAKEISNRQI